MRKLALAAVAFSALALSAPAAHAAPAYEGGCGFDSNNDPTGQIANPDTYTGVIYAAVVGYDDSGSGNPATVTVTCNLKVNGATVDTATFSGTGVAAGAEDTSFVAQDGDTVQLCDHVTVNGHDFGEVCGDAIHITIPPDEFWQAVDEVFTALDPVFQTLTDLEVQFVDPIVCPIFQQLAPVGVPGVTQWNPEGDWFVAGELFWDCPPYQD